ncbi:MAG: argininosuccinate lyase [Thermoanaerobaculia bacterium]|nr:argininosuccinate lyase [Thermoanaerobaculia bacterium]
MTDAPTDDPASLRHADAETRFSGTDGRRGPVGGRFGLPPSEEFQRFSSSLAVDLRMLDEDIDGSLAHATMLGEVGILSLEEAEQLREGLEQVRHEMNSGRWVPGDDLEDVHMAVETRLTEIVGDVGKKLHTARSRNDQVATDVRLWLRRRLRILDTALSDLVLALLERVERDGKILMPGYTHLQRGQPIFLGHHLLAHAWPLARDRERLQDAMRRIDRSPLGACAMAGTPHPIDRERSAEILGFAGLVENAMDGVSARDHEQEVAAACAICLGHLSRQAEELVLWSSSEFRFVRVGESYATGSSIMPQKRNPDAAELLRGQVAQASGAFQALLMLTKGLSLAYNRDLQDDRRPLFDVVESAIDSVRIAAGLWRSLTFDAERFEDEMRGDFSLATELADLMAQRGVPFREAHEVVGRIVRWCEERGENLGALTSDVAQEFHPRLHGDLGPWLDPRAAAERRTSRGGTAWSEIERQVALLREDLA